MIQDIPKLYTALAEWLACVLFVRLLPQRYNAAKTAGILAAALPLFGLVQWLIGIVPLSLWIPGMIVALVLMCIYGRRITGVIQDLSLIHI